MTNLLLIDNFDSFTYNLVQGFESLGAKTTVVRNNALSVAECLALKPRGVVISPGPGSPIDAGISKRLILACLNHTPLLGICLGHQCLSECFGGKIRRAKKPMHGKVSEIKHNEQDLFAELPNPFIAARYHSLAVEESCLPESLEVTAYSEDGEIMGLKHRGYPLFGVQFHPESVATPLGDTLLKNFLRIIQ